MSQVAGGLGNVYIGAHTTQYWNTWWNNGGWQGLTLIQPQPLNTGASMAWTVPAVSLNNSGQYVYSYSFTNNGPNSTYYNAQIAKM
jgi:hypothetical protein